ncbi:hypothetical protein K458DRAFT_439447 [Lentithecium fluviatile CBS 122367]|uniref:Uncharacterized protein n=1 Tax=Lentithecium fluviatile CBS 122367 TaxID=1168545 RepID=A0A6G1JJ87_9PLEO|nr:hypothetical protein K458DRAFT_439447 [Lentithecium fluviatile CBS 122367]
MLTPQDNRNGWINPEDLSPMPQCIAQQDPSPWLSTMTGCTGKQCTHHFGAICTHHQWLTQASCLSTGFSSDILYRWIRDMTGRTWLVDVGDANELQNLFQGSLSKGYAAVSVTQHAPTCLKGSVSALSMESFQHVMASCSFTSTTQHTGRADRPWQYQCFCRTFTIDTEKEPCSGPGHLNWTQEQLWIYVTCGPTSLTNNWTDSLRRVTGLVHHCATDACGLDSSGYCKVKRTVDRACICRNINFETCGGSCQIFETRIAYVEWLHNLCSDVQDWRGLPENWRGLPENWRQLAAPTALDMIPWQWTIKPSNDWNKCASNEWKLGSFILVNAATFLAALHRRGAGFHPFAPRFPRLPYLSSWFSTGMLIAALQLLANLVNVILIQGTLGYEDIPVTQLILLWCSMPRLAWLTFLLIGLQPFDVIDFSAAKSSLFAEIIFQALSAYYMVLTVNYGRKHNFYFGSLESAERGQSAKIMYAGALLWLVISTVAFVWSIRVARRMNRVTGSGETSSLVSGERNYTTMYGTLPVRSQDYLSCQKELAKLYAITAMNMLLLWFAQWVFWGGFIGLSAEEYVFMLRLWSCS